MTINCKVLDILPTTYNFKQAMFPKCILSIILKYHASLQYKQVLEQYYLHYDYCDQDNPTNDYFVEYLACFTKPIDPVLRAAGEHLFKWNLYKLLNFRVCMYEWARHVPQRYKSHKQCVYCTSDSLPYNYWHYAPAI